MHKFWGKVEHYNIKLIPYALIALLLIIIYDLLEWIFHLEYPSLQPVIEVLDYLILAVFVIDLIFLAFHARKVSFFFKHYWLDLLAVFPFNLFFRLVESLYLEFALAERFILGQAVVHESLETEKLLKAGKFSRLLKAITRSLRVITKSRIFSEFREKHHRARRKKRTR